MLCVENVARANVKNPHTAKHTKAVYTPAKGKIIRPQEVMGPASFVTPVFVLVAFFAE